MQSETVGMSKVCSIPLKLLHDAELWAGGTQDSGKDWEGDFGPA